MNTDIEPPIKNYESIASDFPKLNHLGAVPGSRMKLLIVEFEDKYYTPEDTPPERFAIWLTRQST
ncbi:hypothetical protein H8K32_05435 [Undibacterium jejuense]|uniref:Uncharacterized protein n=1 Tax=Undibacterium jejuense TaxID=1344949 RepID=A0A923KHU4_9BURK|nr:hypothetical protein [Undibacterium jejuense]MBC3861537.1 hypothetical protein [Undibacterium jejuense]